MDRFMSHAGEAWGASVERLRVRRGLFAIMGSMSTFDQIQQDVENRYEELRPSVAEFKRLGRLLDAMRMVGDDQAVVPQHRTYWPVPMRHAQIIDLLKTAPMRRCDLAKALDLTPGRVVQLIPALLESGLVREDDQRILHAADVD
jgi:hypothetical protein